MDLKFCGTKPSQIEDFGFLGLLFLWLLASQNGILHYVSVLKIPFEELRKKPTNNNHHTPFCVAYVSLAVSDSSHSPHQLS